MGKPLTTVGTSSVFKYTLQVTPIDMVMYIHINGVMYIHVDIQLLYRSHAGIIRFEKVNVKVKDTT